MHEPTTAVTDWLLAGVAGVLATRLWGDERPGAALARRLWALALALTAVAALLGGLLHAFTPRLPAVWHRGLWQVAYHAVGAASFLLVCGTLRARLPAPLRTWLAAAFGLKLGLYAYWTSGHPDFRYAVLDYGLALLTLLALELRPFVRADTAARSIVPAILLAFAAAAGQQARLGFGPVFNHNDVYHVLQVGVLYLLARGGAELRDL